VAVKITDLGLAQRLADLGPGAREAAAEDLYQVGVLNPLHIYYNVN
jgi:hypothetical protein